MIRVVLVHPEIAPNTGNVIRLCANTGARLHLIEPLGFALDSAKMRRAGLDYHEIASMQVHASWRAFVDAERPTRAYAMTASGRRLVHEVTFARGDWLVFGCESSGLSAQLLREFDDGRRLRLPMRPGNRSLNLSNAVAVTVFEAWRQFGFDGAAPSRLS